MWWQCVAGMGGGLDDYSLSAQGSEPDPTDWQPASGLLATDQLEDGRNLRFLVDVPGVSERHIRLHLHDGCVAVTANFPMVGRTSKSKLCQYQSVS